MVGKLHKSWQGGLVYMLVAVDKFTKWVEAAPVTTQDSTAAISFIKSIVFRFGVPYSIITDNGTNFTSKEFKSYFDGLGIKLKFASVVHPKTNGQVEKANGLICSGIKKEALSTSRESQGRVLWVKLDKIVQSISTSPLGGFNPRVIRTKFLSRHGDLFHCKGCADNPIIFK
jgi:transposase InsO family protein